MNKQGQRGFTLIELIIFVVVVGVGIAGMLLVMNTVVKSSADPMVRKQTIAIAESMMEEILLKEYSKPTGSSITSASARALYDSVADYNGYKTTAGIVDVTGTSVSGLSSYNFLPAVKVEAWDLSGVATQKVTVSVTGPGGIVSLTGYRANY